MEKSLLAVLVCLAFMAFIFSCKQETPKQAEAPNPAMAPAATPTSAPPAIAGGTILGVSVSELVAVVMGGALETYPVERMFITTKAKRRQGR